MVFFYFVDFLFPPSVVVQGFEDKVSFVVDQFFLGSPPSVEVQGFVWCYWHFRGTLKYFGRLV